MRWLRVQINSGTYIIVQEGRISCSKLAALPIAGASPNRVRHESIIKIGRDSITASVPAFANIDSSHPIPTN